MTTSLDSAIPKDSWTLYWHPSEGRDWSIGSFLSFGTMKTWRQFFTIMEAIKLDTLSNGMFFLMRDPIPPLWENCNNVYGGAYSFRVPKPSAGSAFEHYAIATMLSSSMADPENVINGLSISQKKTYNIIKIWNTNSGKFKRPDDILCLLPPMKSSDVLYTPFTEKKM
jgi:hypothetical protein